MPTRSTLSCPDTGVSLARFRITLDCGLLAALGLSGCGWTVTAPRPPLSAARSGASVSSNWWRDIGGRTLDSYVREALGNSPTVEALAARVELARADARLLTAASQPSISAQGARQFGRRQAFETGGERADAMRYAGGVSVGWEMDFWGRVRQLRQGARRQVEASEADEEAGKLLLIAEIARLDLARRRLTADAAIVAETLAANDESVERLAEKYRAGITDESVVDRQRAEGEALGREIEEIRRARRLAELALDRLLGREPGRTAWPEAPAMPDPPPPPTVVKTEVLARRPDIRASAERVAATWHLSNAATLDLLPKLQLSALASGRTMRLTPSIDEWIAQVAPTLEVPVWDPARLAQVKQSKARAHLAAVEYRENVLRAFEETAAALANITAQTTIERSAHLSAESLRKVHDRTLEKFRNGVSSQLDVLEDQRRSLEAQRAALLAREARLAAWIDLKSAIGG